MGLFNITFLIWLLTSSDKTPTFFRGERGLIPEQRLDTEPTLPVAILKMLYTQPRACDARPAQCSEWTMLLKSAMIQCRNTQDLQ